MKIRDVLIRIENNRYLNWKVILLIYLLTRISLTLFLSFSAWNGSSLMCYAVDCKQHWRNTQIVVEGGNPYEMWEQAPGSPDLPLLLRADHPPLLYVLMPLFVWIWKSIWAMFLIFFIFDFVSLYLVASLSEFKKTATLLYIIAPSIIRGLVFAETEIFTIAFILASVYFLNKKSYVVSTIFLSLAFNVQFFPVILFPILLMNAGLLRKQEQGFLPERVYIKKIVKYTLVFISISVLSHLFFFPKWKIFYEYRTNDYTLISSGSGIWKLLQLSPESYYLPVLLASMLFVYLYIYLKNPDTKTSYLLGALTFIVFYPRFSFDHFIILIPLFLVWSRLDMYEIIFWMLLSVGIMIEFLGLPTIGIITTLQRQVIGILILFGFYLVMLKYLKTKHET